MDRFSKNLLDWYDRTRRKLPWREAPSPYRTWISEVMLQQTRVETVLPYYDRFMKRFPDVESLANASEDEVLGLWSGLGYYSRARNMHRTAQLVRDAGQFPFDSHGLRALPGIGEYMAAAIASIALNEDVATVDGNIARVMSRLHADPSPRKKMWEHARLHLPKGRAGDYNQALMDLGARLCVPRNPRCEPCPVQMDCSAYAKDQVDQFPPPKPKRKVPEVFMGCLAAYHEGRFWYGRRPNVGLWAGLWEFPTTEFDTTPTQQDMLKHFGVSARCLGEIRHVLTHRIVHMSVFIANVADPVGPYKYAKFGALTAEQVQSIGTSSLTQKAIAMAQDWMDTRE